MSWKKVKLGDICTIEKGAIGIQKAIPGEYPMVVTGEERKSHNEFQFDDEAVLIPLVSGTGHGHASIKRIHFQKGKFALGNILCAVIPKNKEQVSAEYLYRFLDLNKEDELVARMKGMANVTLPIKEIAQIEIPLPTLKEQNEFVEKYKDLEIKSELLSTEVNYQLSLVKKLRHQLLQDAMQGKIVPIDPNDEPASELLKRIKVEKEKLINEKKFKKEKELPSIKPGEIPFEIPESWVWCRLNDICDEIIDCPHSTPHYLDTDSGYYGIDTNCINEKGEITWLRSMSFESYQERIKRLIPKENDIIYAREGSIGLATFIPSDKNICLGQRVMLFRASQAITAAYLKYAVTDIGYKNRLLSKHRGMGAKHVNVKDIVESLIPIPPIDEQKRIVLKIDQLIQTCNDLEESIKQIAIQNEKLLQQVLREALRGE
jgi:type I restriction enzyme, S subunit